MCDSTQSSNIVVASRPLVAERSRRVSSRGTRARPLASICQHRWPRLSGAALVPRESECSARAALIDFLRSTTSPRVHARSRCGTHERVQSRSAWSGLNVVAAAADACQGGWRYVRADQARKCARARAHQSDARRAHAGARARSSESRYRFHVDMGKCIGCKCCVVACNEQNGNPASINWRRVARDRRRLVPDHDAFVSLDGVQPLPRADVPARDAPLTPTRKIPPPASCATARMPASAVSTARGTARTACRSTTPSAASWGSATCAMAACRSARHPPA